MKYAIVGSRGFLEYKIMEKFLNKFGDIDEIISGGAKGADSMAELYAREKGIKLTIFPADWEKYGKSAGMIRNKDIINNCDVCVAFWDGISKGTKNSISLAQKQNKMVYIKNIDLGV